MVVKHLKQTSNIQKTTLFDPPQTNVFYTILYNLKKQTNLSILRKSHKSFVVNFWSSHNCGFVYFHILHCFGSHARGHSNFENKKNLNLGKPWTTLYFLRNQGAGSGGTSGPDIYKAIFVFTFFQISAIIISNTFFLRCSTCFNGRKIS